VNANPLAGSIFDATTAGGIVQHEVVKKDVDCIIAEVDRDGMGGGFSFFCVCNSCVDSRPITPLSALKRQFPFPLLNVANFVTPHREQEFLRGKICLFRSDSFTMWVAGEHRLKVAKHMVQKGRAVTENSAAPCVVRKEAPMNIKDAHRLLEACGIGRCMVMQYGQKADLDNKVVEWALKNVRMFVCSSNN
jgi:hypothetical protein